MTRKRLLALLIVLCMLTGIFSASAFAGDGGGSEGAAAPGVPTGGYVNLAYVCTTSLNAIERMDFGAVTHINCAFGLVRDNGKTVFLSNREKKAIKKVVELKKTHNPGAKAMLSIGSIGSKGFQSMVLTSSGRGKFIQSCKAAMGEFELDGIDLGWAPASMGAGAAIEATPKGKKNLTLLLRELRAALGDGALITMACSACDSPPDIVDWAEAVKALDFINLMAHGCNIEAAVKSYAGAGCPQDKINIGCVAGAALVPAELQGPAGNLDTKWSWIGSALSASGWDAAPHDSEPAWHRVESALDGKTVGGAYGGATRRIEFHKEWDGDTGIGKVFAYDLTGDPKRAVKLPVMTYMDEQSVKARADFIIQNGLRGAFLRCYSDDTDSWLARAFSASFRKNDDPKGLPWPFTPTEWVLDKMAGIDIDEYGYGQYDDVWLVKRALGASPAECGAMGSPAASVSEDERGKFLQDDGEYSGLYQGLLDQEAQMIKLWLADLAAPRPDEDWQRHMSRIAQARQKFAETPGYYKMVEPGRRASVLGADSFANNEDGKKIIAWQKLYDRKFQSECYKPGKVVENLIRDMDPTDPAKVEAARYAYDQLDGLARSCVMNYQTLTRAEGLVNPDGSDIVRPNVAAIGMSRTAIQEGGVQAESYEPALASLRAALPGAEPLFIWASGTSGGQLAAGAAGWSELADSGCLKHPAEHYQQMGIALAEDPVGDEFFAYLDKNFPEARVYLLLANMDRLIEPQMDVLSHRAKQYGCIKGLAVDVEWYDSSLAGCGLEVSDYRARIWNEDVYSHWGEEYSLALMHSDAHHLPAVYRGGADGKSNPLVFIDSTHGYGSWDGSHGGRRSEPDAGGGADLGNGGSWAMFAEYFYPNQVIFQTGYRQDQQWMYSFEDPFMRSYVNKCAEVVAPDQEMGVAWVDSNCSGFPEFPSAGWCTQNQQLTELAARTIGYLSDYNGDNSNLLGGNWGYFTEGSGGPRRLPANAPGYYDALWVKHVRDYCNALVSLGAAPACFIGAVNYQRFLEIEPRACDILIGALPALRKIRAERDKGRVYEAYSMYAGLTEAQKAEVTLSADLLAAKARIDLSEVSTFASVSVDADIDIDKDAEFTLSLRKAEDVLTVEATVVVDGNMLEGIGIEPLSGFAVISGVSWKNVGGSAWKGTVTLAYLAGGGAGFTSQASADIAKLIFATKATGDAALVLAKVVIGAFDREEKVTYYHGVLIEDGEAATNIDWRTFSKYDLNRDGAVDALDLCILLLYGGFNNKSPGWDTFIKSNDSRGEPISASMCDFNGDGTIDILDQMDLYMHYGKPRQ